MARKMSTRKGSRKDRSRKDRSRKVSSRRNRRQRGGNPSALSFAQGREYAEIHANQHGGGASIMGAPLSQIDGSMLESGLRMNARVLGLDQAIQQASLMRDENQVVAAAAPKQAGGARKSRKASRKGGRKAKASRKGRSRRQQGGGLAAPAPYGAPSMLLTPAQAARAGTADFSNPLLRA